MQNPNWLCMQVSELNDVFYRAAPIKIFASIAKPSFEYSIFTL